MSLSKVIVAGLIGLAVANPARAFDFCRVYEFEELKTFSTTELQDKYAEYESIYNRIGTIAPESVRELKEDFSDKQKCSGEMERMKRILDGRAKAEAKPKPATKKNAGA